MGYSLGAYKQAEVSPLLSTRSPSRFAFDATRTVFRIPAELIVEVLTYFGDPHHNILLVKVDKETNWPLLPERIERLTVIRKLTMTCWHLRNTLFPLLWKYVEGCNVLCSDPVRRLQNGLYAQCAYLVLNPAVGAYVQCVCSLTRR